MNIVIRGTFLCPLLLVVGVTLAPAQALPQFMQLPFRSADVQIQQGWIYEDGKLHGPFGAIDYINGALDDSRTWESFDVVAAADGVAIWDDDPESDPSKYGNMVVVRHDQTDDQGRHFFTLYAHLQQGSVSPRVPKLGRRNTEYVRWARVTAGEVLGRAGSTGFVGCVNNAQCTHLHFEVNVGSYYHGQSDPYHVLNKRSFYPGPCISALWFPCPPTPSGETPLPPTSPVRLQISTGDNQSGPIGAPLPNAVSVLAVDEAGNPVGLVPVTFRVTSGGGCVSASPAGTNCQPELTMITNGTSGSLPGLAGVFWTLGSLAGTQTVEVVSPGLTTITFSADAR